MCLFCENMWGYLWGKSSLFNFMFLFHEISLSLEGMCQWYTISCSLIRKLTWLVGILLSISVSFCIIAFNFSYHRSFWGNKVFCKEFWASSIYHIYFYCPRSILNRPLTWSESSCKAAFILTKFWKSVLCALLYCHQGWHQRCHSWISILGTVCFKLYISTELKTLPDFPQNTSS